MKVLSLLVGLALAGTGYAVEPPSLVGVWRGTGRAKALALTFQEDGTVRAETGQDVDEGSYGVDYTKKPIPLTTILSRSRTVRSIVEFTGPDGFRRENAAPGAPRPKEFTPAAVTFVRQKASVPEVPAETWLPGRTLTNSRSDNTVQRDVLKAVYSLESQVAPESKHPRVVATSLEKEPQAIGVDQGGKLDAKWIERWTVQRDDGKKKAYRIGFAAHGSAGTEFAILPAR